IESLLPIAGAFDHLLEDGSAVIPGRSAALNELRNHRTSVDAAPGFQLAALVGDRKVVLSLPARGGPHVECGAGRRSRSLSRRMRRLIATFHMEHTLQPAFIVATSWIVAKGCFELFRHSQGVVEKRPEVGLDDVKFAPGYRDLLRKVVDNDRAGP